MPATILLVNCTRLQRFVELRYWSLEDTQALLDWHLNYERHFRKGWNNNMSLVNYDVSSADQELTWSLMLYKLESFEVSYVLIMPFKFETDSRDLPRAYTSFALVRDTTIVYCRETNCILTGAYRAAVVDGLIKRIYLGFGWKRNPRTMKAPIRRYRLLTIIDNPDRSLTSKQDVHHKDGIAKIRGRERSNVNDTISNLEDLPRAIHRAIHSDGLDSDWVEM